MTQDDKAGGNGDSGDDRDDDRARTITNIAAFVFLAALVAGGVWLIDAMVKDSKLQDCLMAGRRNCAPLDIGTGR